MRIPFLQPRRRDYALEPLTIADSPAVSVLHREDFVRPWTDGEFAALLEQDTVSAMPRARPDTAPSRRSASCWRGWRPARARS